MMIWQDRNMSECLKVFYVKLYVHLLVDKLKWFKSFSCKIAHFELWHCCLKWRICFSKIYQTTRRHHEPADYSISFYYVAYRRMLQRNKDVSVRVLWHTSSSDQPFGQGCRKKQTNAVQAWGLFCFLCGLERPRMGDQNNSVTSHDLLHIMWQDSSWLRFLC